MPWPGHSACVWRQKPSRSSLNPARRSQSDASPPQCLAQVFQAGTQRFLARRVGAGAVDAAAVVVLPDRAAEPAGHRDGPESVLRLVVEQDVPGSAVAGEL